MDLNELKKLINEEVKRTRQKNLLKEQGGEEEVQQYFMTPDAVKVLKNLINQMDDLPQTDSGKSFVEQSLTYFFEKLNNAQKQKEKWQKLINILELYKELYEEVPEISLSDVSKEIKNNPNVFNSIKSIFSILEMPKSLVDNFENDLKQELENYEKMKQREKALAPTRIPASREKSSIPNAERTTQPPTAASKVETLPPK